METSMKNIGGEMQMQTISHQLVKLLKEQHRTLAVAESLTGGMIASEICAISGASDVFLDGVVSYSNESKIKRLGVNKETLEKFTAVSEQVAKQMAQGVKQCLQTDIGLSSTGVAGPDDFDSDGNPKGLYYIALSYDEKTTVRKFQANGERNEIRRQATASALTLAYEILSDKDVNKTKILEIHETK